MSLFHIFTLPFLVGAIVMFATLSYKYGLWISRLNCEQLRTVRANFFTRRTLSAVWEVVREALLHRRIFRTNPLLGYMHMSLAFGWFMLICVGWVQALVVLRGLHFAPHVDIFFRFFSAQNSLESPTFLEHAMDAILLFVLSGVALAWFKRLRSRSMGIKRTTRHSLGDRLAITVLWLIFPARLLAESITCSLYAGGGFLTHTLGSWLSLALPASALEALFIPAWWLYSCSIGLFLAALPFSRYMHIFTEIPLILLRKYGVHSTCEPSSVDNFSLEACSRCGICIDPCQLHTVLHIDNVQAVYFIRDRRYSRLTPEIMQNCLMCGRCASACPVGIDQNILRLNSRRATEQTFHYDYLQNFDPATKGDHRVGYFAGCMSSLTPRTKKSLALIFEAANENVCYLDEQGTICCGRPLMLAGQVEAARKLIERNREIILKHNISTLVTSCPICLKVFRSEYNLPGIEVLHHSEYIERLITAGRLKPRHLDTIFTYHDPCELGRANSIYDAPRRVITSLGTLREAAHKRETALCCGSSLANTVITDAQQLQLSQALTHELEQTAAQAIITSCPLCKKAIERSAKIEVLDIAEAVARAIV